MFALLLSLNAFAGELSPRWEPGQVVRYHAETLFGAGSLPMLARQNTEARAVRLGVVMDLSCVPAAQKKGWEITCDVEKAQLQGEAVPGEQDRLDQVLTESAATLSAATLVLNVGLDGRVTAVDLHDVPRTDERSVQIAETLRQISRRAVAPLDLEMPKNGVDPGKAWKQSGAPLAMELFVNAMPVWSDAGSSATPTAGGVSGGVTMKHSVLSRDAGAAKLSTEGKANVQSLITDTTTYYAHVEVKGDARFDLGTGQLSYRAINVSAVDGASASVRTLADGYSQVAWIARWNADGSLEGPDGPIREEAAQP